MRERGLPEIADLTTRVEIASRVVHSLILQPVSALGLESEERLTEFARVYIAPLIVG
jgi:hypothetical protein